VQGELVFFSEERPCPEPFFVLRLQLPFHGLPASFCRSSTSFFHSASSIGFFSSGVLPIFHFERLKLSCRFSPIVFLFFLPNCCSHAPISIVAVPLPQCEVLGRTPSWPYLPSSKAPRIPPFPTPSLSTFILTFSCFTKLRGYAPIWDLSPSHPLQFKMRYSFLLTFLPWMRLSREEQPAV